MATITQVIYSSDAGPILPELQWHEQIVIAVPTAMLTRTGRVAQTRVNAGQWSFAVDVPQVAALFAQLARVDWRAVRRVVPDETPDGGHTETFTLVESGGARLALVYDPGVTYTNGELVTAPIRAFLRDLQLPSDAASRYTDA